MSHPFFAEGRLDRPNQNCFGHSSRLHTAKILRLSEDLPVIIEIVDSEERINEFLPVLDAMMGSGLVTMEKVQVLQYGAKERS